MKATARPHGWLPAKLALFCLWIAPTAQAQQSTYFHEIETAFGTTFGWQTEASMEMIQALGSQLNQWRVDVGDQCIREPLDGSEQQVRCRVIPDVDFEGVRYSQRAICYRDGKPWFDWYLDRQDRRGVFMVEGANGSDGYQDPYGRPWDRLLARVDYNLGDPGARFIEHLEVLTQGNRVFQALMTRGLENNDNGSIELSAIFANDFEGDGQFDTRSIRAVADMQTGFTDIQGFAGPSHPECLDDQLYNTSLESCAHGEALQHVDFYDYSFPFDTSSVDGVDVGLQIGVIEGEFDDALRGAPCVDPVQIVADGCGFENLDAPFGFEDAVQVCQCAGLASDHACENAAEACRGQASVNRLGDCLDLVMAQDHGENQGPEDGDHGDPPWEPDGEPSPNDEHGPAEDPYGMTVDALESCGIDPWTAPDSGSVGRACDCLDIPGHDCGWITEMCGSDAMVHNLADCFMAAGNPQPGNGHGVPGEGPAHGGFVSTEEQLKQCGIEPWATPSSAELTAACSCFGLASNDCDYLIDWCEREPAIHSTTDCLRAFLGEPEGGNGHGGAEPGDDHGHGNMTPPDEGNHGPDCFVQGHWDWQSGLSTLCGCGALEAHDCDFVFEICSQHEEGLHTLDDCMAQVDALGSDGGEEHEDEPLDLEALGIMCDLDVDQDFSDALFSQLCECVDIEAGECAIAITYCHGTGWVESIADCIKAMDALSSQQESGEPSAEPDETDGSHEDCDADPDGDWHQGLTNLCQCGALPESDCVNLMGHCASPDTGVTTLAECLDSAISSTDPHAHGDGSDTDPAGHPPPDGGEEPDHDDTLQICEYSWAAPWREGLGQICQCGDMNSDDCEMTHDICEAAGTGIQTLHDCYQLMMTIAGAAETSEDQ